MKYEMSEVAVPEISIIITFYNARRTLIEAVNSVLSQTFSNFELLLVDDGSTDGSMKSLENLDDTRLVRLQAGRIGRALALNLGLRKARGGYIAILDADDVALPQRLEEQKQMLDNCPDVGLICSSMELMDEDGNDLGVVVIPTEQHDLLARLLQLNPFAHSSVMYRRQLAIDIGGYNERCEKSIDFNFYLEMLSAGVRISGQAQAHIRLRYYASSWGKVDGQALQMLYGILGVINYYLITSGKEGVLRGDETRWRMIKPLFVKWFERQGYRRRYEAKKALNRARIALSNGHFMKGIRQMSLALRMDFCCWCYRGVGFVYPRDAEQFIVLLRQVERM